MNSKKKIREFVLLEKSTPRKKLHIVFCLNVFLSERRNFADNKISI